MIKSKSKSKSIKELGRRPAAIKECRELGFGALAGPESRPESIWTVGGGPQATGSVGAGEWNGVVGCAGRCVGAAGRGRRGPGPGVNLAPCGRDFGGSKRRFFGPCSRQSARGGPRKFSKFGQALPVPPVWSAGPGEFSRLRQALISDSPRFFRSSSLIIKAAWLF